MTERSPVTFRISSRLNMLLAKAAHKCETSKNDYVIAALQAAVRHDLPDTEYRMAWEYIFEVYLSLEPDIMNSGAPNADMRLASALETVLPRLRGAV